MMLPKYPLISLRENFCLKETKTGDRELFLDFTNKIIDVRELYDAAQDRDEEMI